MNKKVYQQINETLYEEVLPNGLKVYLLPKADFHKTYGLFSTNYGSVDNHFGFSPEALHQVPDGIAHFLEHKLFEKKKTAMSFKPLVSRGRLPMPLPVSRKLATFFRQPIKSS